MTRFGRGHLRLFATVLAVLCLVEQVHVLQGREEESYRGAVTRIASRIDPASESFLLVAEGAHPELRRSPMPLPPRITHIAAMWAALEAGVPTVNGFYGNHPPGWDIFFVDVPAGNRGVNAKINRAMKKWRRKSGLAPEQISVVRIPAGDLPWHND